MHDGAVTLGGGSGDGALPTTLRDLVWQRVGALGPESRDALSAAAVLGVEFEEPALTAIVDIDGDALADLLDRATAAGIIAPAARGRDDGAVRPRARRPQPGVGAR